MLMLALKRLSPLPTLLCVAACLWTSVSGTIYAGDCLNTACRSLTGLFKFHCLCNGIPKDFLQNPFDLLASVLGFRCLRGFFTENPVGCATKDHPATGDYDHARGMEASWDQ